MCKWLIDRIALLIFPLQEESQDYFNHENSLNEENEPNMRRWYVWNIEKNHLRIVEHTYDAANNFGVFEYPKPLIDVPHSIRLLFLGCVVVNHGCGSLRMLIIIIISFLCLHFVCLILLLILLVYIIQLVVIVVVLLMGKALVNYSPSILLAPIIICFLS